MKIKFMSNEFDVIFEKSPYFQDEYRGKIIMNEGKIIISEDDINKTSTLLHEIIHLIDSSLKIGLNERQITQIEAGIYHALKENGMLNEPNFTGEETV